MKPMPLQIAIDGPVASGKGTVARLVAQRLHLLYIDTGAMYRMTALLAQRNNVDLFDEAQVLVLLEKSTMELRNPLPNEKDGRLTTVLLDGEDVSWEIRTSEVGAGSSKVASLAKVREHLVKIQQQIAAAQDVIMEGRDITYRVLPDAQIKIYLTASPEVRTRRRHVDLQRRGEDVTYEKIYADIVERDQRDMQRTADPLQMVEGVWVIDSSTMSIDQVVEAIVEKAKNLKS